MAKIFLSYYIFLNFEYLANKLEITANRLKAIRL